MLSQSDIAAVRALVHAGKSVPDICGVLNLTPQQVSLALEGYEGRRPDYDTCHVGALRRDGKTVREIAEQLGLTPVQVRGAVARCGL